MINILLKKNGVTFGFVIDAKKIIGICNGYSLPYMPSNLLEVRKKILISRNKLPPWLENLFRLTPGEQAEFDNAKDELELKKIILKDAKKENCEVINVNG